MCAGCAQGVRRWPRLVSKEGRGGALTVRVVHSLLGAELDKRLPVLLKRAGGGDDHLISRSSQVAGKLWESTMGQVAAAKWRPVIVRY